MPGILGAEGGEKGLFFGCTLGKFCYNVAPEG